MRVGVASLCLFVCMTQKKKPVSVYQPHLALISNYDHRPHTHTHARKNAHKHTHTHEHRNATTSCHNLAGGQRDHHDDPDVERIIQSITHTHTHTHTLPHSFLSSSVTCITFFVSHYPLFPFLYSTLNFTEYHILISFPSLADFFPTPRPPFSTPTSYQKIYLISLKCLISDIYSLCGVYPYIKSLFTVCM